VIDEQWSYMPGPNATDHDDLFPEAFEWQDATHENLKLFEDAWPTIAKRPHVYWMRFVGKIDGFDTAYDWGCMDLSVRHIHFRPSTAGIARQSFRLLRRCGTACRSPRQTIPSLWAGCTFPPAVFTTSKLVPRGFLEVCPWPLVLGNLLAVAFQ